MSITMQRRRKLRIPTSAVVALSFLVMIFFGTALLSLPFAVKDGGVDFVTSLFTATSATCVTGLVVTDTFSHWTYFGQIVILCLIQIGGLGFITIFSLLVMSPKRHTSLSKRKLAMQTSGSVDFGNIRRLLRIIFIATFAFEFVGAFLLCISFVPVYGWGLGIWQSVFCSVSAFCNAGFTITDAISGYSSLMQFASDPLVLIVVAVLIIVGGLGFLVWGDVVSHGVRFKRYSLHAKVVLTTTVALVLGGWLLFALFEWNNPLTLGDKGAGEKILGAFFLSVTPRTAGFNIVNYADMTAAGNALTIILMLVGGSPASTAGGIKTVTVAVFFLSFIANARRSDEIHCFKRRFEKEAAAQASSVVCIYIVVAIISTLFLCAMEGDSISLEYGLFEVSSALGTVGLSCGITSALGTLSKLLLVFLMYFGRVGGLTMVLIFSGENKPVSLSYVSEKVIVG